MRALLLILLAIPLHAASNQIELRDSINTNYCSVDSGGVFGCTGGPAPTNSSCGTTGFAVLGNDNAFRVTVGAGVAGVCQVNFGHHWESATVICVGSDVTTGQLLTGNPGQTIFKMSGTLVAGDVIQMKCANIWTSAPAKSGVIHMVDAANVTRGLISSNTIANFFENQESGTSLSVTGCGSFPSIVGSSRAWRLSVGTSGVVQPCSINFTNNWDVAPHCVTRNEDSALVSTGTATTSSFPISNAAVKDHIDGFCEDQVVGS